MKALTFKLPDNIELPEASPDSDEVEVLAGLKVNRADGTATLVRVEGQDLEPRKSFIEAIDARLTNGPHLMDSD